MTREVSVKTPENVEIGYELAGIGSRGVALFLDSLIQGISLLVLFLVFSFGLSRLMAMAPNSPVLRFISDIAFGAAIVVAFVLFAGYFIYFEVAWNGQTPGKRWMGIRVIKDGGAPIDVSSAVIRNLIRIIESQLGSYLISFIVMFFSPKYQRLGDYAAGTIVVKERNPAQKAPEANHVQPSTTAKAEAAFVRDVGMLTKDELDVVKRFVMRRSELAPDVQETVARQIAEPVMSRLGTAEPNGGFSHADFLEEVYRRCVEERGLL